MVMRQISQFPYYFFQNAVTVDLFAYVKLAKHFTLRASIMNLTDTRYWLWDDLRQIISPVMLVQHSDFFRGGLESVIRFSSHDAMPTSLSNSSYSPRL